MPDCLHRLRRYGRSAPAESRQQPKEFRLTVEFRLGKCRSDGRGPWTILLRRLRLVIEESPNAGSVIAEGIFPNGDTQEF